MPTPAFLILHFSEKTGCVPLCFARPTLAKDDKRSFILADLFREYAKFEELLSSNLV
jgi:hypothetical protein